MPLERHLSSTLDHAARQLARLIGGAGDPFAPVVIALGNRAQETWLRHEVATRVGIAANWHVLPWRAALDRAVRACLRGDGAAPDRWWVQAPRGDDPWQPERLRGRVVEAFRALASVDGCEELTRYLFEGDAPPEVASWREMALAGEVAGVVSRLMRERPDEAVQWAQAPEQTARDVRAPFWFRRLCLELRLGDDEAPCRLFQRLRAHEGEAVGGPPLVVFGVSSCSAAESALLAMVGWHMDVRVVRVLQGAGRSRPGATPGPSSPVLQSLGLAEEGLDHEIGAFPPRDLPGPAQSHLKALQSSAQHDTCIEPGSLPTADPTESLTFHACYSPLRQVELLRVTLLRWFAADRDLEPRDVLVLTPDLGTYAPLIQAVFARRGAADSKLRLQHFDDQWCDADSGPKEQDPDQPSGHESDPRPPAIPVAIADLGLARTNPVAEALLAALELCEERVTAPRLLALLSLEPVHVRFGLSHDDAADMRALLVDSGMRWGLDGADRGLDDQPKLHQNTIEFGLERLALGSLMADEDLDQGLEGGDLGPLVPMAVDGRARVARVARLAAIIRAVGAARARFREERQRTLHGWNQALRQLMDDLAETSKAATWLRVQVVEALDEVLPGTEGAPGPQIDLRTLRKLVAGCFELPTRGDRVVSGAVSVRRLSLDAATPAEVVCFLGMDDAAFPAAHRPREWEPVDEVGTVSVDPRVVERLAMLQALMAARRRVFIAWCGYELKRGRELPPCVPVDELVQIISEATGLERAAVVLKHARHPWGREELDRACFDQGLLQAARALALGPLGAGQDEDRELPPEDHPVKDLPLDRLARDLVNPAKLYLYGRLAVYLDEGQERVPDREPIELDKLEEWAVRTEALAVDAVGGADQQTDAVVRRLAGRGLLPLQAGGRVLAASAVEQVTAMREVFAAVGGQVCDKGPWTVPLGCGITVSGKAQRVRERAGEVLIEWLVPSKAESEKVLLNAWVHLLAAKACDDRVVAARLVGSEPSERWLVVPGGDPKEQLNDLVTLWQRGRREPLPLLPRCSMALAQALMGKADEELRQAKVQAKAASEVRKAWDGFGDVPGTGADRWVVALWPDLDSEQVVRDLEPGGFVDLALKVWRPVLLALSKVPADGWAPEGGEA